MKVVAGAIVLLAGAVLFGSGTVGYAILNTAKLENTSMAPLYALTGGAVVGLIGLALFALAWASDATPRMREPSGDPHA